VPYHTFIDFCLLLNLEVFIFPNISFEHPAIVCCHCAFVLKKSVYVISDLVYMFKENNIILSVHCHCCVHHTKYVLT
jgi:hypothetical protein